MDFINDFMKKIFCVLLLLLFFASFGFAEVKNVVPGVTFEQILVASPAKQLVNVVKVDLTNPDISVAGALADKNTVVSGKLTGKQPVSTITKNNNAVIGINADYFIMESFRDPLNLCVIDGNLISEPGYSRSVIAFDKNNKIYFDVPVWDSKILFSGGVSAGLSGINRYRNQGEFILYSNDWGSSTKSKYAACDVLLRPEDGKGTLKVGETKRFFVEAVYQNSIDPVIPDGKFILSGGGELGEKLKCNLCVGDFVDISFNLKSGCSVPWEKITSSVGGGPMLVKNGRVCVTGTQEKFDNSIINGSHPRSGVGVSSDGRTLIIVSLDGRQGHSAGLNLNDFARVMLDAGAYNAMNLDGGGSTALSIAGLVVNSPSGISERSVADAILVYSKYKGAASVNDLDMGIAGTVYRAGSTYDLPVPGGIDVGKFIWADRGAVGYVLQDSSTFWAAKSGAKGSLGFIYDGKPYSYPIEVSDAPIESIVLANEYYDTKKTVSKITLFILDKNKKPVIFSPVFINITGGFTEKTRLVTGSGGETSFDVIWDETSSLRNVNACLGNVSASLDLSSDVSLPSVNEQNIENNEKISL